MAAGVAGSSAFRAMKVPPPTAVPVIRRAVRARLAEKVLRNIAKDRSSG
jgi:hypothetical protein